MDLLIKCNVGTRERQLRLIAGAGALFKAYKSEGNASKLALGAVGALGLATGMTRYCPLYHLFGVNNCQPAYRSVKQLLRRI